MDLLEKHPLTNIYFLAKILEKLLNQAFRGLFFFANKLFFNLAIEAIEKNGINCYKIGPTITFEECEEEKVEIFNNEEYECIKK